MLEHKQAFTTASVAVRNLKEFFFGAKERRHALSTQTQSEVKQNLEHLSLPKVQDCLQNQPKSSLTSFTSQNGGEKQYITKRDKDKKTYQNDIQSIFFTGSRRTGINITL